MMIYVVEDAPNSDDVGGDVWFIRDVDGDGVAESLDHFLSMQISGSETTGMTFNPVNPTEFVVSVQHPDSTRLTQVPDGFGDALWAFDLTNVVPPPCSNGKGKGKSKGKKKGKSQTCTHTNDFSFIKMLEKAGK